MKKYLLPLPVSCRKCVLNLTMKLYNKGNPTYWVFDSETILDCYRRFHLFGHRDFSIFIRFTAHTLPFTRTLRARSLRTMLFLNR